MISTVIKLTFISLVVYYAESNPVDKSTRKSRSKDAASSAFFSDFRGYDEIGKFLDVMSGKYPDVTKLSSIGKTVEGRDIRIIKITDKTNSSSKPVIYLDGGMHAREWAGISTALYVIQRLLSDYQKNDQDAVTLLKEYEFFIVPLLNADGYEYTRTTDRMWRKNRGKIPGSKCKGVDLNRNYPFHWGGVGSSHDPCEQTYCGPKPLSEPESTSVRNLIMENKSRMKSYITLHAYGQWWLYPWGYDALDSPNVEELKRVADIGYAALRAVYGTTWKVGSPGKIMYPAQGSDDWAHGEANIPYVYTLEMRPNDDVDNGFILPKSDIIPAGIEIYEGIKAVAKAIINTVCTGNVCQLVE